MRKFLFLDVDGVLNNPTIMKAHREQFDDLNALGEEKLTLLKAIVNMTGCEIVLSSTWRMFDDLDSSLGVAFSQHEIPKWIGMTPVLNGRDDRRRDEIQSWLVSNGQDAQVAIVDDDPDAEVSGLFFLRTDPWHGLMEDEAGAIIRFFQSGQKNFCPLPV